MRAETKRTQRHWEKADKDETQRAQKHCEKADKAETKRTKRQSLRHNSSILERQNEKWK